MGFKPNLELQKFLDEDLGLGDVTSNLLEKKQIIAKIITRQETIVSGTNFAKQIFSLKKCNAKIIKKDGSRAKSNQIILEVRGDAASILSCERTEFIITNVWNINKNKPTKYIDPKSKPENQIICNTKNCPRITIF